MPRPLARASRPLRRFVRSQSPGVDAATGPDFVGVGAQRCGTTWWWRLICDHPRVHVSAPKEAHFFDRYFAREFSERDAYRYRKLFSRPQGYVTGEWTPRYMHDHWTPALLAKAAPTAKLLVLLRDPLARYRSGLSHELDVLRFGVRPGRRREYFGAMIADDALSRSLYGRQMRRLFDSFDPDRVLVLQYERCVEDPASELRRTFEFLGVEPVDHAPEEIGRHVGRRHSPVVPTAGLLAAVGDTLSADLTELEALVPGIDLGAWPSVRELQAAGS